MSSGGQVEVLNLRERNVSSDHNRLQAFADAQTVNILRMLFDPLGLATEAGDGTDLLTSTVTDPLRGHILHGIMVVVPVGGTELGVTTGMAILDDPDGQAGSTDPATVNPDDCVSKICYDPDGVLVGSGELVLTANASGSLRVDVVEIRRLPNVVEESDSRDIYNPSTGGWAPVAVPKVSVSRIEYRIRTGTGGAGFPGTELGWLPIAVISVPDLSVIWDTCTFYDVRPLVSDRANGLGKQSTSFDPVTRRDIIPDVLTAPGEIRVSGVFDTECMGYRMGGIVRWSDTPGAPNTGADVNYIDIADTNYHEAGLALGTNKLLALHLVFPFGLPRWVRYSVTALAGLAGRGPYGIRGIPVLDAAVSADTTGLLPSDVIAFPPAAGLGAGAATVVLDPNAARVLCYIVVDNAGAITPPYVQDNFQILPWTSSIAGNFVLAPISSTASKDNYKATTVWGGGVTPTEAKQLLIAAGSTWTATGVTDYTVAPILRPEQGFEADTNTSYFHGVGTSHFTSGLANGATQGQYHQAWVPVVREFPELPLPDVPSAKRFIMDWNHVATAGAIAKTLPSALITGWKF